MSTPWENFNNEQNLPSNCELQQWYDMVGQELHNDACALTDYIIKRQAPKVDAQAGHLLGK